ncbi:hypothetical protein Taro_013954, partial [Colocasia esculenta]|nr:hypothetical protein [Colocasia esculenta]
MRTSGSLAGVQEVGSLQLVSERGSTEICVRLPCKFRVRVVVGCSCCYVACVASMVARCVHAVVARLALDSLAVVFPSASLLGLSRCFVCHVASLVERCDTCLWLLSAWCWLVVSSGEVLPESFSVGFGGKLLVVVLGLRYAVGLAGAFWQVFPEQYLGGSGGGSPFVASGGGSSQKCSVFVSGHHCVALWFEVCRLVGLRYGEVLPGRILALLVEVLPKAASCGFGCVVPLTVCLAIALARLSRCSFP